MHAEFVQLRQQCLRYIFVLRFSDRLTGQDFTTTVATTISDTKPALDPFFIAKADIRWVSVFLGRDIGERGTDTGKSERTSKSYISLELPYIFCTKTDKSANLWGKVLACVENKWKIILSLLVLIEDICFIFVFKLYEPNRWIWCNIV